MSDVHITTAQAFGGSELAPFTAYFKDVDSVADQIIGDGARDIARLAEFEVGAHAYKTGRLQDNFIVTRIKALSYRVSNFVYYASYVHDGTIHMAARPFMDWAVDDHGDTTTNRLLALLRNGTSGGAAKLTTDQASAMLPTSWPPRNALGQFTSWGG